MTSTSILKVDLRCWLEELARCVVEFAATSLDCRDAEILGLQESLPGGMSGAYLAMLSMDDALQIAVVSSREGCRRLSGALLGMEPGEAEDLSSMDVADAMGEIINIIAGMVKVKMADSIPNLNLGLPLFMDGRIHITPAQEAGSAEVRISEVKTQICVVRQRESGSTPREKRE